MDAADLIQQARAGDEAAINALLSQHRDFLRRLAEHALPIRLKARIDASDIVQQTCLSAIRQIGDFAGSDPQQFAAWLRQVHKRNIRNVIRDQLETRKRGDGRQHPLDFAADEVAATGTPSQIAMSRETAGQMSEALQQLPDDEQLVLRLRYLEGLPLAEIADTLGITREAVLWRMQKGMKRLRQVLPPHDDTLPPSNPAQR